MTCKCIPKQKEPHIVKSPACRGKDLRFKIRNYGFDLGRVYWNIGNAIDCCGKSHWLGRDIRFHFSPKCKKLIDIGGYDFWDVKNWK